VIGANLTKQLGGATDLRCQMLMLMDDFTPKGRMGAWAKRISIFASHGVHDICIVWNCA